MKNTLRSLFLTILLFTIPQLAHAINILDVYKDAYIEDYTFTLTPGPDGIPDRISDTNALLASRGEFFDEYNNFNVDSHIVMTFDISQYIGKTLSSAYLTGNGRRTDTWNSGETNPISGLFYIYAGDGLITLEDFNIPATYIGEQSFAPDPNNNFHLSYFALDITPYLQSLLNDPLNSYAEIRVESASPTVYIQAGEFAGIDVLYPGPQLALTVVPEPISSVLMLLGGGMIFLRRKSNRTK